MGVLLPFKNKAKIRPSSTAPWALCSDPSLWSELDPGGGTEIETLYFLETMVQLLKPEVIVETGTMYGASAAALARGVRANGFGHIWSYEVDQNWIKTAKHFLKGEKLNKYVTILKQDSLTVEWPEDKPIDLLFIDGATERVVEFKHFSQWLSYRGIALCHDAGEPFHRWDKLGDAWQRVYIGSATGLLMCGRKLK